MATIRLGDLLVKQGLIQQDQMNKALEEQKKTGGKLGSILVQMGFVKELSLLKSLEQIYQTPAIDLGTFQIQPNAIQMIPKDVCEKYCLIPVQKVGGNTLVVAFSDPSNQAMKDDLRFISRCKIQPVVATEGGIIAAIDKFYGANVKEIVKVMDLQENAANIVDENSAVGLSPEEEASPIVKFVNAILAEAIRKKVSDVHFEPYEKRFRVRYRIDGNMVEASSQAPTSASAIASRIKIMSKLDIAEKRRPQDGRIKLPLRGGKSMDFRVSILPTIWGEKIVLRLLDQSNLQLDMTKLGFETEDLVIFKSAINKPQGLLLITGPTGSGKTTTIYSALAELNQPDVNIATAEDPVEFNLEGINQVQMNADIDLTFAAALRSFLRQDPDVIMVGEIRDLETAEIAMKAASTGHMVVSTLHTNDAPQTIIRLTEMGVAPYIITSTLNLIVAQRLVGKVCESCKEPLQVNAETLIDIGVEPGEVGEYKLMKGKGCQVCNGSGIKGRIAIFELMQMTSGIKDIILRGGSSEDLRKAAKIEGMKTLRRSALLKLKKGQTTIEEVVNTSIKDT